MTQEELIREVGKVIPNGMYSEEVIQLAFTMFTHGYNYAVDKACEWLFNNLHLVRDWSGTPAQNYKELVRMLRKEMEE